VLLAHPNRVLNRDQLLDLTQGREADPLDRPSTCRSAACATAWATIARPAGHQDGAGRGLCAGRAGDGAGMSGGERTSATRRWRWWPRTLYGRLLGVLLIGLVPGRA
jgi:hypothetical protein